MNKAERKEFIQRVKQDDAPEKTRTSFSLDKAVYERFLEVCRREGISASSAVQRFMKDFSGEGE